MAGIQGLWQATTSGDHVKLKDLIDKNSFGGNINQQDDKDYERTALIKAVTNNKPKCVEILGHAKGINVNVKDKSGYTALRYAYYKPECLKMLLKAKGPLDVNVTNNVSITMCDTIFSHL